MSGRYSNVNMLIEYARLIEKFGFYTEFPLDDFVFQDKQPYIINIGRLGIVSFIRFFFLLFSLAFNVYIFLTADTDNTDFSDV